MINPDRDRDRRFTEKGDSERVWNLNFGPIRDRKDDLTGRELAMVQSLLGELPPLYFYCNKWFCYNQEEGRYEQETEGMIARRICDLMENPMVRTVTPIRTHISWILDTENPLRTAITEWEDNIMINVKNGVVAINRDGNHRLISHSSDYKFSKVLPVNYIEEEFRWEEVCPIFTQVLQNQLPLQEDQELFLLTCANALIPYRKFEVCVVAIGEGGTGKTTLYDTIGEVFGDCKTSLTLNEICRDSQSAYGLPSLWNSMINIGSEIDARELDSTNWKRIISNEAFTGRQIYGTPEERRSYSKLVFLCNMLPKFKDGSTAEMRRIRFIPFEILVADKNKDTRIFEALKWERDGVFMLLLKRLSRLLKMTDIPHGSTSAKRAERVFKAKNDPLMEFKEGYIELGNFFVTSEALMRLSFQFVNELGMASYMPITFVKNFRERFHLECGRRRVKDKKHPSNVTFGCKIKDGEGFEWDGRVTK